MWKTARARFPAEPHFFQPFIYILFHIKINCQGRHLESGVGIFSLFSCEISCEYFTICFNFILAAKFPLPPFMHEFSPLRQNLRKNTDITLTIIHNHNFFEKTTSYNWCSIQLAPFFQIGHSNGSNHFT